MPGAIYANLFWLVFSLATCAAASQLRLGEIHQPGPGLYPLAVGVVMALLSTVALAQAASHRARGSEEEDGESEPYRWWNIVIILVAIAAYSLTLEWLGFLVNTFLFVGVLLKVIEPQPWRTAIIGGALTAAGADLLFNVVFRAQIPVGIAGF